MRSEQEEAKVEPNSEPSGEMKMDTERLAMTLLRTLFYLCCGTSGLFVFNCVLSMQEYFESMYGKAIFTTIIFSLNLGGVAGFLLYPYLRTKAENRLLVIVCPVLMFVSSALSLVFGELLDVSTTKSLLCGLCTALIGFGGSMNQCASTCLVLRETHKEMATYNGGLAVAGILTSAVAMVEMWLLADNDIGERAAWYLIFQAIVTGFIIWISIKYWENIKETKSSEELTVSPKITTTFLMIHPFLSGIFYIFMVSMSVHPAMTLAIGLNWDHPVAPQITLLNYNIGNLLGNALYHTYPANLDSTVLTAALLQTIYIIAGVFGVNYPLQIMGWQALYTTVLVYLLSLLTGYLCSALLHRASLRIPASHHDNSSFLLVFALMSGLLYGSFANLLAVQESP